jgi:hypothetical protein
MDKQKTQLLSDLLARLETISSSRRSTVFKKRRNLSWCIPCTIASLAIPTATWFITDQLVSRYWAFREQQTGGKTLRGQTVTALSGGEVGGAREEGGSGERAPVVANLCQAEGYSECDLYEDWVEYDGTRYHTGYHLENCRHVITSVSCGDDEGPSPGSVDPGAQARKCLHDKDLEHQLAIRSCRRKYSDRTRAIQFGQVACVVIAITATEGAGLPTCAWTITTLVALAAGDFTSCMHDAHDTYETAKAICVGG